MNRSSQIRVITPVACVFAAAFLVSACTSALAPVTTQPEQSNAPFPSPVVATSRAGADIIAVSASKPGAAAQAVLGKCNIGDQIELKNVTGMGMIASPKDLPRYVPLTGREPQLVEAGPAWIVTVHAKIPQPGSSELWTDPTCVVTGEESGWFATGVVTDTATGKVTRPEAPVQQPDLSVPPLLP
jgi:hypothetical protein